MKFLIGTVDGSEFTYSDDLFNDTSIVPPGFDNRTMICCREIHGNKVVYVFKDMVVWTQKIED